MRTPGTTVSAVGHLGLIGWLILGWGFDAEPLDFSDVSITIVSEAELEQLTAPSTPVPGTADPTVPVPPQVDETSPSAPTEEQPTETTPPPDPVEPPVEETPPPPAPPAPPVADVTDTAPVEPAPPADPPSTPEVEVTDTPTPQQADRVTSIPSAPPPPDSQVDDVVREEIVPDDSAEPDVVEEEQEPTAPDVAATEIVIEDETPSGLVETSLRPVVRPRPPAPETDEDTQTAVVDTPAESPSEPDPEPDPPVENEGQSVDDVLAGLDLEDEASEPVVEAPALPLGQGLTNSESGAFFSAIGDQWTVNPTAESARVVVTVTFSIGRDRRIVGDVSLESASAGSASAQEAAFQNARRAIWTISRSGGFPLPEDKFEFWSNVRLTFDPSEMRIR